MKKYCFSILFIFIFFSITFSQAIRKEYKEMTASERIALRDAFYQLRDMDNDGAGDANPNDDDLINDLGDFHLNFFSFDNSADPTQLDLHLNLPDEPTREIFLAWHRAMIFELEQYMQDINPNIGMPYWNTIQPDGFDNNAVIADALATLFTTDFMGPFDADWSLGRNIGAQVNSLPEVSDLPGIFNQTDFFTFSNRLERRAPHSGGHRWVGGVMQTSASSRDPIFYLHHAFVDKLWNDWETVNQNSSYIRTDMLRYDGTYTFYGVTKPLINPNDIVDAKVYGTFYAENQLALLEDYTVSNTYNTTENFYYQYTIESGNNFTIPNTKDCKFESVNEIVLTPGFLSETGSNFIAKIDTDNDINTLARNGVESKMGVSNPFDVNLNTQIIIFNEELAADNVTIIKSFPNPFTDKVYINLSKEIKSCKIKIYNMMGKVIRSEIYENVTSIELDGLYDLSNGVYVLEVSDSTIEKPLIVRRLIKL